MTSTPDGERADPGIPTLTEVLSPGAVPPAAPPAEGVPSDIAGLAERVSARLTLQLADDITTLVERRCHDALIDQIAWLVQFIGKQVADELEQQLPSRIRQAILDEMARGSR
ncbi:hypothetical protein PTE30175_00164 [Pandoraea terrae]|uniref:DUF2486 domain-containing protein n=1 Tax=Pandoraea terrae TaxID=1537710 RepID=A0A5E4RHN1_9BURK|nr:DUF2486 family protein [Pandoraea terrae]VVD62311.1 hypothetical protein PTE30175_00164 [Pandoraea terrae]